MRRRDFLQSLAGLAASAGLPACRRSEESIFAYVKVPEGLVPGVSRHYATTLTQLDSAFGVTVETHDAHPTKIEGNPKHPESQGATTAQLQAALFDLYDVDRSRGPAERGSARSWTDAERMLDELRARMLKDGGATAAILIEPHRSPTLQAQLASLRVSLPHLRVVRYSPLDAVQGRAAARLVFGRELETIVEWGSVDYAILLDADPFGQEGSPITASRAWASRRSGGADALNRLYVVESSMSLSGTMADHHWPCESHKLAWLVARLATMLAELHALSLPPELFERLAQLGARLDESRWAHRLRLVADELAAHRGRGVVLAGARQPTAVHALVHLLNHGLSNVGATVRFTEAFDEGSTGPLELGQLCEDLTAGRIKTLLTIGANPTFTAPGDLDFPKALEKAEISVHLGSHLDETARISQWHLNLAHELESFSDAVARDGTASVIQPVILPLWGGRTAAEIVARLAGTPKAAYDLVRATWRARYGETDFEELWRRTLVNGIASSEVAPKQALEPDPMAVAAQFAAAGEAPFGDLELVLMADANLHDGRWANNAWLQELPHPITKTTWGNPAFIAQALATKMGIRDGQLVRLSAHGCTIEASAIIVPGQAEQTVSLSVGQGHSSIGRHGNDVGVNAYPMRRSDGHWVLPLDELRVEPRYAPVARSQHHFDGQGRKLAREHVANASPGLSSASHHSAADGIVGKGDPSLPQAWGMVIDLSRCNGCQACVVACQAENNVPFVGRDAILRDRSMSWLRIDRYFDAEGDVTRTIAQPVPCQQCERAPCEAVCPVGATAHSPEGLNDMVYNRCVGSRYCANNCPFEVRRFNFFEHNAQLVDVEKLRMNPDVTVRSRGVMEKCTFCVQRIQLARIDAKKRGLERISDGAVVPACAQACPAQAISFGDLTDPRSRVHQQSRSPLAYRMLEELNVEPRVHYLARLRNPHPNT